MRRFVIPVTFVVGLLVCIASGLFFVWWFGQLRPVSPSSAQPQSFIIRNGSAGSEIAGQLEKQGLVKSSLAVKIYLKANALEHSIRPGHYSLSPSLPLPQIISELTRGPGDVWVTLIEGWRREQIAAELSENLVDFDTKEFLRLTASLEGQLFPDTYLIPKSASVPAVIEILTQNFARKSGLSLPEDQGTLILASLIEREAKSDPDRGIISGILLRRLDDGWPLQVDATAQFASDSLRCSPDPVNCRYWQPDIDTKTVSQFNTYLHPGLPPSPICNPGLAAILAASNPLDSAYWYYLTAPDGVTRYAVTHSQHLGNIDKYLIP